MNIEIRRAGAPERAALARMLELYQHDLSDIWDQDLDAGGEYGDFLDRYWDDAQCHAFVATADGRYAGFALVDGFVEHALAGGWWEGHVRCFTTAPGAPRAAVF